jgi:hypothetical protein
MRFSPAGSTVRYRADGATEMKYMKFEQNVGFEERKWLASTVDHRISGHFKLCEAFTWVINAVLGQVETVLLAGSRAIPTKDKTKSDPHDAVYGHVRRCGNQKGNGFTGRTASRLC